MSMKVLKNAITAAFGAVFATSLISIPPTNAGENPFAMTPLSSGYMVASDEIDAERPSEIPGGKAEPYDPSTPIESDIDAERPSEIPGGKAEPYDPSAPIESGIDAERPTK